MRERTATRESVSGRSARAGRYSLRPLLPLLLLSVLAGFFAAPGARAASAHPVSVSRASVYVTPGQINVRIEVFLEDLFLFHNLKANDQDFLEPTTIREGMELHKQFVLDKFTIRDVSGVALEGRVVGIRDFEMPAEGVALAELMAHTLTFEIQYELNKPPEFLTFGQEFTDAERVIPSEMKLVLKQENAGTVHSAELRPGDIETVRLSWTNPPLSPEASAEEREEWLQREKEETLGITSYSSVYSFLYIERHEVRHEILIPLLTLEESVLIARDGDEFLDLAEQDAARQQISAFFRAGNPVTINGQAVEPIVQRCDFFGLDFKDFARQAEPRKVSLANARVGIILVYPTRQMPEQVTVTWNRFNSYVWTVNMVVFAFDETIKKPLSRLGNNNVFTWVNPGVTTSPPPEPVEVSTPPPVTWSVPLLSLACLLLLPVAAIGMVLRGVSAGTTLLVAGLLVVAAAAAWPILRWETESPLAAAPALPDERAENIFRKLHENTYRAFDYQEEEAVYDALAASVDGDLLRDLYLQILQGLKMQEQGGAVSRIREVTLLEGRRRPLESTQEGETGRGFAYRCRWNVSGTVEHWGHIHSRTNQYEAVFSVEPRGTAWKITDMDLLDEQRVNFETKLRGL